MEHVVEFIQYEDLQDWTVFLDGNEIGCFYRSPDSGWYDLEWGRNKVSSLHSFSTLEKAEAFIERNADTIQEIIRLAGGIK